MRKVCPCNGCRQTQMCVSHDNLNFYCNRCLPYYTRQNAYWVDELPNPHSKQSGPAVKQNGVKRGTKGKQSASNN